MSEMSHDLRLDCSHDEAIERITDALAEEGFGVLSRIDVHDKFREKLDVDFRPYTILGACNPALANVALGARPEIGLLLPCNVTVEDLGGDDAEDAGSGGGRILVRIIDAERMMEMGGYANDPDIAPVGRKANERLRRVAETLRR